ncbi:hypothetical protein Tco_0053114 [Tanacetum coccineum]
MSTSNQQTLAELGAFKRPPMLEKESYVPWASCFMRFLDNNRKKGSGCDVQLKLEHIKVMNYLLQGIPNDIYNFVNACKTAKQMWEWIRRLMHASKKTKQQRHSRLVDEFGKFMVVEGESLSSVYERLTTLVNVMEQNNIRPLQISINTKFLNSLQPEWSKYHVIASRAKKDARNHDPLALVAHSNVHSSHSHASPSYSHSPQSYYVTHPLSVTDYKEDYQGMERVNIQRKDVGYVGNGNRNAGRSNKNQIATKGNGMPNVHNAKYFREHMLLAMNDEARGKLNDEENAFMLDNHYGDDSLEELNAAVIIMARIQPPNGKADAETIYDADTFKAYEELEQEIRVDKDKIDNLIKEKDKIQDEFFQLKNASVIIRHETELSKKAFKARENKYLEEIMDLKAKLSSFDQTIYKIGQSIQTIHMLGKKPNKVYDPFLKGGLGYQNPECLKKAIKAQPKMYDGERLQSTKLITDSEKTLEDAKENRLKMKIQ